MVLYHRSPYHPEVLSIKRIIALEGDTVYTRAPYPYPTAVVPLNHVWVEGDNKDGNKTLDSNHYGPIAMPLIVGKVAYVLWPWNSFGSIPWWEFKGRTTVIKGQRRDAPRFD
jgi:inner membrane protease subunit 2